MNISIIYEDDYILAVDKTAGMIAQNDNTGRISLSHLVMQYLGGKGNDNPFLGPVHRLDRPVSGVMLFAKTRKAAGRLSDDFRYGRVKKMYYALVEDNGIALSEDWIEVRNHIVRKRDRAYISKSDDPGAKEVVLLYKMIFSDKKYSILLVKLITGQRHQIRIQLSASEMPVVGDRFYGAKSELPEGIICLHSSSLSFPHPETEKIIELSSPVPSHFKNLLKK